MNKNTLFLLILPLSILILITQNVWAQVKKGEKMTIHLTSSAFNQKGDIPVKYTCDGVNISPPLSWSGAPSGTKSYALLVEDPDAPSKTWIHWVVFNIPASQTSLNEHFPAIKEMSDGIRQGTNDFRNIGYGGPCPPNGTHHYYFKIYALDNLLKLPAGSTKKELEQAMKNHILAEGELMGTYSRH